MTRKTLFTLLAILLFQVSVVLEAKQTSTKEGVDIFPIASSTNNGTNFRIPIYVDIFSHTLSVTIGEGINVAQVVVTDSYGAVVDMQVLGAKPGTTYFRISNTGYYRIDIYLSNGDQYYGFFTVYDGIVL